MGFGDVYNTTVNVNGSTVFRSRYSTDCCCYGSMYSSPMMSCFGYGFGGMGFGGFGWYSPCSFSAGLGAGVGYAAGAALVPALPNIFKGIGQGLSWIGTKVIAPAATFAWNNVLKPVGNAVWSGIKWAGNGIWQGLKWIGNGIAKGAKAVGKGISSLFHKKNKTKTEATQEK